MFSFAEKAFNQNSKRLSNQPLLRLRRVSNSFFKFSKRCLPMNNSLHIQVNSIRDLFLELFYDFKMELFFFAITASIVQRLERLLCFALRRKYVYGELFVSHVFVVGELPNVA